MQTKYEQITQLRETATLINQMEASIQRSEVSMLNFIKYDKFGENAHQVAIEQGIIEDKTQLVIRLKQQFDSQLSNIKPYYQ